MELHPGIGIADAVNRACVSVNQTAIVIRCVPVRRLSAIDGKFIGDEVINCCLLRRRRLRHREHHHKQHRCPSRCAQPLGRGREKVLLNGLTHCCLFLIIFVSSKYAHKKPYGLAEGKAVYVACRVALVRASLRSDV